MIIGHGTIELLAIVDLAKTAMTCFTVIAVIAIAAKIGQTKIKLKYGNKSEPVAKQTEEPKKEQESA